MEDKLFGMIGISLPFLRIKISIFAVFAVIAFAVSDFSVYPVLVLSAAAFHELGHVAAAYLCGRSVDLLTIYPFGADIRISGGVIPYKIDFAVSSAGIAVNLVLAALFSFLPFKYCGFFAAANAALAILNLIPVKGLDGGRMADCLLYLHLPYETAQRMSEVISYVGFILLCGLSLMSIAFSEYNLSLVFICAYLLVAVYCKEAAMRKV